MSKLRHRCKEKVVEFGTFLKTRYSNTEFMLQMDNAQQVKSQLPKERAEAHVSNMAKASATGLLGGLCPRSSHLPQARPAAPHTDRGEEAVWHQKGGRQKCQPLCFPDGHLQLQNPFPWVTVFPRTSVLSRRHYIETKN